MINKQKIFPMIPERVRLNHVSHAPAGCRKVEESVACVCVCVSGLGGERGGGREGGGPGCGGRNTAQEMCNIMCGKHRESPQAPLHEGGWWETHLSGGLAICVHE